MTPWNARCPRFGNPSPPSFWRVSKAAKRQCTVRNSGIGLNWLPIVNFRRNETLGRRSGMTGLLRRLFGRQPAPGVEEPSRGRDRTDFQRSLDLNWMFPPRTVSDSAAYDQYWQEQLTHGTSPLMAVGNRQLHRETQPKLGSWQRPGNSGIARRP